MKRSLVEHFPGRRMAFVVGPRQVGKTTLARRLLRARKSTALYRNWDDLKWRRALSRDPYGFVDELRPKSHAGKPLVVLDEIHRYPRWKRYIKGLWDTRSKQVDLLVTGSGRLDVYQRGGERLGVQHKFLVLAEAREPGMAADVHVIDAPSFLAALPV